MLLLATAVNICAVEKVSRVTLPWVLTGYRSLTRQWLPDTVPHATETMWREANETFRLLDDSLRNAMMHPSVADSLAALGGILPAAEITDSIVPCPYYDYEHPLGVLPPAWLADAIQARDIEDDFMFALMMKDPHYIDVAEWHLPIPPRLPGEDTSFMGFVRHMKLPGVNIADADTTRQGVFRPINWLHTLNLSLQLSQAYISHNWYQGGSDYLAFFGNFLWDVQLNEVYHPKLMFQSTLNYKLAINSTKQDKYHKYAVSQELFQYNIKFGYKATRKWYWTVTAQFKTQFLNSYAADSPTRMAAFLSPGTLNVGAGMTYSLDKPSRHLKLTVSLAPVSYNLKTCIDSKVDHAQIGMQPGQRVLNEYGSNAEVNFSWAFRDNITYTTRLFLFTDYKNFTGDWENTLNFQWSKLFSTQIYLYFRYDTATDTSVDPKWKKWMLKEILSVGLSYNFSTKVK